MQRLTTFLLASFVILDLSAQDPYLDSLRSFRNRYTDQHEVVTGDNRKQLQFYPIQKEYCVPARFERVENAPWFRMATSGRIQKVFRVYGILHFSIRDSSCRLSVYQSQNLISDPAYAEYLFIPFTDPGNGEDSYEGGRYIDLRIAEVESPGFLLDFNKAYNPYCAYVSDKYNCPIPPAENALPVVIRAGEMKYKVPH